MKITNQKDLRRAFWEAHPQFSRLPKPASGTYHTDTRVAFCDWIDSTCRDGTISEALASRATLEG